MSPAPVTFCLRPGRRIGGRYSVVSKLGSGWEGEVYRVIEDRTGVERAAKLFYPQRNPKSKAALHYARKLDRLRHCSVMIQYHHWERITVRERDVDAVISEVVDGIRLSSFLRQQSGGRSSVMPNTNRSPGATASRISWVVARIVSAFAR